MAVLRTEYRFKAYIPHLMQNIPGLDENNGAEEVAEKSMKKTNKLTTRQANMT
jgi:hypothetical protein